MFLDKVILLSAVTAFVYAGFTDVGEEEAIAITNCFYNIMCFRFEKKPEEFKRLADAAKNEELEQEACDTISSIYDVLYSGDLDDFIAALHKKVCKELGYKDSAALFTGFVAYIGQLHEDNNCKEEPESTICEALTNGMAEMEVMMEENKAEGICCDKNEPNSKRCKEDAKLGKQY